MGILLVAQYICHKRKVCKSLQFNVDMQKPFDDKRCGAEEADESALLGLPQLRDANNDSFQRSTM